MFKNTGGLKGNHENPGCNGVPGSREAHGSHGSHHKLHHSNFTLPQLQIIKTKASAVVSRESATIKWINAKAFRNVFVLDINDDKNEIFHFFFK